MPSNRHRLRARTLDAIRVLVGALSRSARSVERRTGVTTAQLFVLRQLAEGDRLSLGEIANRTLTRQSTVSVVVARLERRGLLRRDRAADDRRRLELSLTTAGRRLVARAPVPTTGRLLGALDQLTNDQLGSLSLGLAALTAALGVESRSAGMLFEGE
jgi:DNA-binding MarR family transcriptional regulator